MKIILLPALAAAALLPGVEGTGAVPRPGSDRGAPQQESTSPQSSPADAALAQDIRRALREDPTLSPAGRSVDVLAQSGRITLSGQLAQAEHRRVRECVARVAGVRFVQDDIFIHPTATPADSAPALSAGQRQGASAEDDALARRVREALAADAEAARFGDHLAVETRNGVVWLNNNVWDPQQRARIIAMLRRIEGVTAVEEGRPGASAPADDGTAGDPSGYGAGNDADAPDRDAAGASSDAGRGASDAAQGKEPAPRAPAAGGPNGGNQPQRFDKDVNDNRPQDQR